MCHCGHLTEHQKWLRHK